MRQCILSDRAKRDLIRLDEYTIARVGLSQAVENRIAFETAFADLAAEPGLGHVCEDLAPPGRALRFFTVKQRFVLIYEPTDAGIVVARIMDGSQDVQDRLDQDA